MKNEFTNSAALSSHDKETSGFKIKSHDIQNTERRRSIYLASVQMQQSSVCPDVKTIYNSFQTRPTHCNQSTHGCHHGDSAVLQLNRSTSLERSHVAIGSKSNGVPESDGSLDTQLVLECSQRRSGVVGPVSPCASGQTILQLKTAPIKLKKYLI